MLKGTVRCQTFVVKQIILQKISFGSAISSLVKLRFPALLLRSPCIIFAEDKLRLGNIKSGKTAFSRLAAALALHYLCRR
jgi:hypothetical protein